MALVLALVLALAPVTPGMHGIAVAVSATAGSDTRVIVTVMGL